VPAPAPGENIFTLGNPVTPASLKALQKSEKLAKYRQKRLKRNVLRPADPTRSALAATRLRDEHGQFLSEERVLKMKLDGTPPFFFPVHHQMDFFSDQLQHYCISFIQ
jgi:hypothetical protein